MPERSEITRQNQRAWDEIAPVRHNDLFPGPEFFRDGGSTLDPAVVEAAGDVHGRRLLHLQCATGSDTLSWSLLGAAATGVDISPRQIEIARKNAQEAGLDTHFETADVFELPSDLLDDSYDLVFTGGGAIVWLPELASWAETIGRALRPGGRLILHEEHPVAGLFWVEGDELHVVDDYFGRGRPIVESGWGHFRGGEDASETKYEFAWPLGDVVTALARAGLVIEQLTEFPSRAAWRFGDRLEAVAGLPGEYLLVARRP